MLELKSRAKVESSGAESAHLPGTEAGSSGSKRLQQLDLLRALAICLVLFRHVSLFKCSSHSVFGYVQETIFRGGWIGVDLFFVLSGFLVSGLLFREYQKFGAISFRQFFIRRGFKIYPAYWALLALGSLVLTAFGRNHPIGDYVYSLLFLQNYGPFIWPPTWSLAVEEHFYIILPVLLCTLIKLRKSEPFKVVPLVFLATTCACTAMRIIHAKHYPFSQEGSVFPTHLRIDSLMFGVVLSYWCHFHKERFELFCKKYCFPLAVVGTALLSPAFIMDQAHTPFVYTVGYNLLYIGSGLLLMSALAWRESKGRLATAVATIGTGSYSIYLWHAVVNAFAVKLLFDGSVIAWVCYVTVYLASSIVFGIFMAGVVEKPALMIRDKWMPSRVK